MMTEKTPTQTYSTPMMKQYQSIKEQHGDCLLFFRLGDFYELFFEDAKIGAQILNITLTRRPRGKDGDIPMAGVPFHASDIYIAKLVKAGYKVAICEQISEPDPRGIVEREVIRIVTPGTLLDEKILNKKEHNHIISLSIDSAQIGIAITDLSTGDFQATQISHTGNLEAVLGTELARFSPTECILNRTLYQSLPILKILRMQKDMSIYCYGDWDELAGEAPKYLREHFQLRTLQSFGIQDKHHAQKSSAALLGYLKHTQKDKISHIKTIRLYEPQDYVILDRSTITNLELFSTIREQDQKGSFIQIIDQTTTPMGGRKMRDWIKKPLTKKELIESRLDAVDDLLSQRALRDNLENTLKQLWDIPRIISRLSVGIGNAYDLVNLKQSLKSTRLVKEYLACFQTPALIYICSTIDSSVDELIELIETNVTDNPPVDLKIGGIIRDGVNAELDTLRAQVGGGKNWITRLEKQERERTGINSLKIKFNRVFGYYIEISKANLHLVPTDYMRRQTMINAERFITPELKEYEEKVLLGEEAIQTLEYQLFISLVSDTLKYTPQLQRLADNIAALDCLLSFSSLAEKNQYVRPKIVENGELFIKDGRHPVVEKLQPTQFVPNDVFLNSGDHQLLILTGPNMAGKSVFMRQVAIITLMAHLGCFVPATSADISLVDRISVRSGASDVISSGLSTFMVEMVETAHILNHATEKSLIIMDEIGRGTSTYDGISIAWAVAEYLVTTARLKAKTLFATHYHELQMLEDHYPDSIKNYNVAIEEKSDGDPIFLHKVIRGRASHSYAVAVAKLAGVPKEVTIRAQIILEKLEQQKVAGDIAKNNLHPQQSEFTQPTTALAEEIATADLSNMTPLEALNLLNNLQRKIKSIE